MNGRRGESDWNSRHRRAGRVSSRWHRSSNSQMATRVPRDYDYLYRRFRGALVDLPLYSSDRLTQ